MSIWNAQLTGKQFTRSIGRLARRVTAAILFTALSMSIPSETLLAADSRSICGVMVTSASYTGALPDWFDGTATIWAPDSFGYYTIYLGKISANEQDPESILNPSGDYGSASGSTSIFNTASWGSSTLNQGVCNIDAPAYYAPVVYRGQTDFIGYLRSDPNSQGYVDPATMVAALLKAAFGTTTTTAAVTTTTAATMTTTTAAATTTTVASTTTTTVPPTTTTSTTTTTMATATTTTLAGSPVTLTLTAGWNLVGNSSSGTFDVAAKFGDATKVTTVWKWIASGAKWAFYAPSLAGQALIDFAAGKGYDVLTSINGGEGFWVNAKTGFTVSLPSATVISSASFQGMASGWNLISAGDNLTPSEFNRALSVTPPAAGEIPLNLITLWAWDAAPANWYFYAPSLEKSGGLLTYIQSKNYLDFGTKVLAPGIGFWVNMPATTTSTAGATTTTTAATTTTTTAAATSTTTTTPTTTTTTATTTTTTVPSIPAACNAIVYPADVTGGCRIRLAQPLGCQAVTLPFSFEWTTDGTYCETPFKLYITGDPPLERLFTWEISTDVSQGITHYGGLVTITAEDLINAGVTSISGVYHWDVLGWYGSHPDSQPFIIK